MPGARVRYRVAQFFRALTAWSQPVDLAYAEARFSAAAALNSATLLALFRAMKRVDQQHGIEVARALEREGRRDPALLAAALLHDVGKVKAPVGVLTRVFVVLGEHYAPATARRWSAWSATAGIPRGLRRGFIVRQHHARWGAALAAEAGAPKQTVSWILRHHDAADADRDLAALQRADET